jgi:hypothetical protein
MRRISDALDAPGGIDADEELRAELVSDPEARAYAEELMRLSEELSSLGQGSSDRDCAVLDWDALAAKISARLDRSRGHRRRHGSAGVRRRRRGARSRS